MRCGNLRWKARLTWLVLQRLQSYVLGPHLKMLHENPAYGTNLPFTLVLKPVDLADGVEKVLHERIPRLQHGHDGLIFTCADSAYVMGEDPNM